MATSWIRGREGYIDEARKALRELAASRRKAKAIARCADEIQGLLTFQVRRMTVALDEAAAGLLDPEAQAAS